MLRSLVGSEMCIRDRLLAALAAAFILSACSDGSDSGGEMKAGDAAQATETTTEPEPEATAETNSAEQATDQNATQDADSTGTDQAADQSTDQSTQQNNN